nr:NADH dehydrogenase subunit 6 [Saphanus piceus]
MMMILMILIFINSVMFLFMNHPLSFGLILLIQTILISLMTGIMNYNFWFSYILFLIMIGGMLILFTYMTSIASNKKFKFSQKLFYLFSFMMTMFLILFLTDFFFMNNNYTLNELMNQNLNFNNMFSMNKIINYPLNSMFYLIIIYLLITLIMVVKITKTNQGPLRQKF